MESESVSDVFDIWSAIVLPHVAVIAFILTLCQYLCQQCASPSASILPNFEIFSLVQDLGFLEYLG